MIAPGRNDRPGPTSARGASPRAFALGALVAALTAGTMGLAVQAMLPSALTGHGESALMAWLLMLFALAGTVLCLYLVVIWTLAAVALTTAPTSSLRSPVMVALRVLAPRLARRVTLTAALTTTAAGLVLAPASAVMIPSPDTSGHAHRVVVAAVQPLAGPSPVIPVDAPAAPSDGGGDDASQPAESPSAEPGDPVPSVPSATPSVETEPSASPPASGAPTEPELPGPADATDPGGPSAPAAQEDPALPPLGWGGPSGQGPAAAPAPAVTAPQSGTETPTASSPSTGSAPTRAGTDSGADSEPSPHAPVTIVVRPGDSLWSLTDDLLGPATDDPAQIAALWPLLHEANRDVIGPDPNHLDPGEVLTVPSTILDQEQP